MFGNIFIQSIILSQDEILITNLAFTMLNNVNKESEAE